MTISTKNVLNLIVPEYAITLVLMFAVFLLIQGDLSNLVLFFVPAFSYLFALFGFNSLNQVFDAEMDKISKPLRPIPSNRIAKREAKMVSFFFFLLAFVLAIFSPILLLIISFFVLGIFVYSHPRIFLRRFFWATPFFGTIFYAIIPFFSISFFFGKEIPFVFLFFFSALVASVSILKDIEDMAAEKRFGINSVPNAIGVKNTIFLTLFGLWLVLGIMAVLIWLQVLSFVFLIPLFFSLVIVFLFSIKLNGMKLIEGIVTQSKIVSFSMILVVGLQLIWSITSFFS